MSLNRVSLGQIVWKQYKYKIQSYSDAVKSLLIIQLIGIFFSIMGNGGGGTSDGYTSISVNYYSSDVVIVFTFLWMFITSILLTTRAYRFEDFSFVSNRLSSQLSSVLYLITGAIVGIITALLSNFLIYAMVLLFKNDPLLPIFSNSSAFYGMGTAGWSGALYLLLVSSLGYLAGALTQVNKILMIVFSALLIVLPIMLRTSPGLIAFYDFYFGESSLLLLTVKIGITALILFGSAILVLNQREVRE